MAINKRLNSFRTEATPDQWEQMVTDHETMNKDDFVEKYGFTFSAARTEAIEKGYYEPKRTVTHPIKEPYTESENDIIVPRKFARGTFQQTSIQLLTDISQLLQKAYAANPLYDKRYVLNTLLYEALISHGFDLEQKTE